jgi:hypothetical protein
MKKWEYLAIQHYNVDGDFEWWDEKKIGYNLTLLPKGMEYALWIEKKLNEYGEDGWELINPWEVISPERKDGSNEDERKTYSGIWLFKREVEVRQRRNKKYFYKTRRRDT